MAFSFGFSHAYELHYSLFPWRNGSFADRVVHTVERLGEVGAAWWRPHIPWNRVEPGILKPGLRKADVTDAMVAEYAARPAFHWLKQQ
jgi:hypothetical protein